MTGQTEERTNEEQIQVSEQHAEDVPASAAELTVVVEGSELFGGRAALEKAKEVRALRDALAEVGLPTEAVSLRGLQAHVATGLFTRSSSATYTLAIRVDDLEQLTPAFAAVVQAKQATLRDVRWIYEPAPEVIEAWLARCAKRARGAASSLASALGTSLGPVAYCRSQVLGRDLMQPHHVVVHHLAMPAAAKSHSAASMFLDEDGFGGGAELAPTRRMGVQVQLGFRLA